MIDVVVTLLIQLVILAIVVYLVIWVLGIIGAPLPAKVIQLLWVVVVLIAILFIYHALVGSGGLRWHLSDLGAIPCQS